MIHSVLLVSYCRRLLEQPKRLHVATDNGTDNALLLVYHRLSSGGTALRSSCNIVSGGAVHVTCDLGITHVLVGRGGARRRDRFPQKLFQRQLHEVADPQPPLKRERRIKKTRAGGGVSTESSKLYYGVRQHTP